MAVRAPVAGKAREHEAQTVEEFRHGSESAADAWNTRTLMQGQRCRHIADIVHMGPCRLGHAAAGISRERFQVSARSLSVQNSEREGGFARSGHSGDRCDPVQRDIHIDVFQIMYSCSPHLHAAGKHLIVFFHTFRHAARQSGPEEKYAEAFSPMGSAEVWDASRHKPLE